MIEEAAANGADYVKMQSIFSEDLTDRERFEEGQTDAAGRVIVIKRPFGAEFERLKKLDLTLDDSLFFISECKRYNVIPVTTVFARKRVPEVGRLPWPEKVIKVASYDCGSLPFLRDLAEHFEHFIVSTGASFDEEIKAAASFLKGLGKKLTLLHCVTSYPNTLEMTNLKRMEWLKNHAEEVGWSDHTLVERDKLVAAKVAIYLGAHYIERHFTVLSSDKTKDGPVSITPTLLKELSDFRNLSREKQQTNIQGGYSDWEILLGSENRDLTHTELLNRDYYRGRFASKVGDGWKYNWQE